MKKIGIVVGTRPEIIRMAPVIKEMIKKNLSFYFIHTGQHYDFNMSEIFIKELELPKPDFHLKYHGKTHAAQLSKMMIFLEKLFKKIKIDLVLVEGDTNSVLATALVASKLQIPIGHVEAGPRSFDIKKPEEINRVLTDHISTLLFAHSNICKEFLLNEGLPKESIFVTGNTIIDVCLKYSKLIEKKAKFFNQLKPKRPYVLVTLHRAETVDKKEKLKEFLEVIEYVSNKYEIFFPVHPRTEKNLKKFGLIGKYNKIKNLHMLRPLGYFDFLKFLKNSKAVITDSGGVLKEATAFKIPTIIFNYNWPDWEGYNTFWFLSGENYKNTIKIFDRITSVDFEFKLKNKKCPFGKGDAGKKIVKICEDFLEGKIKLSNRCIKPTDVKNLK